MRRALLLFLTVGAAQPAWAIDCATLYALHARSAGPSADLDAAIAACEGRPATGRERAVRSSLDTAPNGQADPHCDRVRRSHATMLGLGIRDGRFDHVVARCESRTGATLLPARSGRGGRFELGRVTSGFGWRIHPIYKRKKFHYGVDLDADARDPVPALAAGVVTFAGWRGGYGNLVEVEHPLTGARTRYAHNERLLVRAGDVVRQGQSVALAGTTGLSTGVHVHLEVLVGGKQVDPLPYLKDPSRLTR